MTEVEWRDIPGYEGKYQVSNAGQVRGLLNFGRMKAGSLLKTPPLGSGEGYPSVGLSVPGKQVRRFVHRLVMLAFVGPCPDGMQVNHINGIRTDNRLENLEYVTASYNTSHAYHQLGVSKAGAKNGRAKLNDDMVREMRRLYVSGESIASLTTKYPVSHSTISEIVRYKKWQHVRDEA